MRNRNLPQQLCPMRNQRSSAQTLKPVDPMAALPRVRHERWSRCTAAAAALMRASMSSSSSMLMRPSSNSSTSGVLPARSSRLSTIGAACRMSTAALAAVVR
eukprot:364282-Chlamydomonas_euryale.AAC.49